MKTFLFIAIVLLSSSLFGQEDYILYAENVKKPSEQKIHNGDKVIVKLEGGHKAKGELEILSETNIKVGESILAVDAIQVFEFSTPGQFRRTKISKNICFITAGVGVGVFTAGLIYANNTSGLDFSGITLMALGLE